jgi:helix-turn-helix protein
MIAALRDRYPVERVCAVLDCPRRAYYSQAVPHERAAWVEAVAQWLLRKPCLGYRRLAAQLKRAGQTVNTKVIRQIRKALGVQRQVGQVRSRTTDSSQPHWPYPN